MAGLVLGVAGSIAEDAWKAVAAGRDLSKHPFIEKDPDEINRARRPIIEAAANHSSNPAFGSIMTSDLVRERTGVNFRVSLDELLKRLPATLKPIVEEAINTASKDLQGDASRQQTAVNALLSKFSGQLDQYDKQLKEYQRLLNTKNDREKREEARARIAELQNQVAAGISIATFVLGRALGDKREAQEIGRVLSGMANIGFALASQNYLGAIAIGLNLIDGVSSNPIAPVLDVLEKFGQRLDQLRVEMHSRFDRLEQQQQQMLIQLGQIYKAVKEGFGITSQRIERVEQLFMDYWKSADKDEQGKSVSLVKVSFSTAMRVRGGKQLGWESAYLRELSVFINHAVEESKRSYFRGADGALKTGEIDIEVHRRKKAENLVGLVPAIGLLASTLISTDLANPFQLEFGAEAYLQADLLLGEIPNTDRERDLLNMWGEALRVRNALNKVSSNDVVLKLLRLYETQTGKFHRRQERRDRRPFYEPLPSTLLGTLDTFRRRWVSSELKSFYEKTEKLTHLSNIGEFYKGILYRFEFPDFAYFRVSNDPIQAAIDLQLIQLRPVREVEERHPSFGRIRSNYFDIEIKKGPDAGKIASIQNDPNGFTGFYKKYFMLDHPPGEIRSVMTPNFEGLYSVIKGTRDFMDYCEKLLGYHYATNHLLTFPKFLRDEGFDVLKELTSWADTASALRLAATIARWRQFTGQELEGQTDVRNIELLSSREEVINALTYITEQNKKNIDSDLRSNFHKCDPRTSRDILTYLEGGIKSDLEKILFLPNAPETKSVPVIDRLLRKLAGYMTANNIEFPVPS